MWKLESKEIKDKDTFSLQKITDDFVHSWKIKVIGLLLVSWVTTSIINRDNTHHYSLQSESIYDIKWELNKINNLIYIVDWLNHQKDTHKWQDLRAYNSQRVDILRKNIHTSHIILSYEKLSVLPDKPFDINDNTNPFNFLLEERNILLNEVIKQKNTKN